MTEPETIRTASPYAPRAPDALDAPEEREGRGSIAFLVGVLVALWAVPVVSTVWLSSLEREVEEVLDPARQSPEDLARVHGRQMLPGGAADRRVRRGEAVPGSAS